MTSSATPAIDYERIYSFRFQGVDQSEKDLVWRRIARWIHGAMGAPKSIIDPAAGSLEFLKFVPSAEKWGVDLMRPDAQALAAAQIKFVHGNIFDVELPAGHFDGAFMSNFLEHLHSPEQIFGLFKKLHAAMRPGGTIAIMGPNFKYCSKEYFDCADHRLILTEVSVAELLYAAGFTISRSIPRFLPYSFRSRFPKAAWLTDLYLNMPFVWPLFGRQFLMLAKK